MLRIKEIYSHPKYSEMTIEELQHVIGNELDHYDYKRLKGESSKEKTEIIFNKFEQARRYKSSDIEFLKTKPLKIAEVFINNKALIITIPHYFLSTRIKAYLEGDICDIYDMSFAGIRKGYKASLSDFIKDGYSIILEYKKKKHILIYNG